MQLPTALFVALRPLFFSADPVCLSFSAEACAILHALCWSRQHQQTWCVFLSDSHHLVLSVFLFTSMSLAETNFLSSCSIRIQWVHGHLFLPGNNAVDVLASWEALLVFSTITCSLSPLISYIHSSFLSDWSRTVSSLFLRLQPYCLKILRHTGSIQKHCPATNFFTTLCLSCYFWSTS